MNRHSQNSRPVSRVEALPLPERAAPRALLALVGAGLLLAFSASQFLPLVFGV